ncbi:hypothetical protein [Paenibacillus sp. GCM10027626]|uniref:hypothetical protein n=1 Tax=Paenibacillus sp. GCM10027626 TaxID=3273411 RepID=UPI003633699C
MKVWKTSLVVLLAAILMVVTACSSGKPPKEAAVSALSKMTELKSYTFKGSFGFDEVEIPQDLADSAEAAGAAAVVSMLKGAKVDVKGTYQADPMRSDITLDLTLGSADSSFNLSIPMIMTKEKMWVKVPAIPGLPIPEEISGKFVEIDTKKLMEEAETPMPDTALMQKLGQEALKVLLDGFDEKTYFSELKAKDVQGLPEGMKPDQIVRFAITPDNFDDTVKTLVSTVIPKLIDTVASKEEYMTALNLKKEDLEQAKKEVTATDDSEITKALEEMKKDLVVHELSMTGAIKGGYLTYQDVRANLEFTPEDSEKVKLGFHFSTTYDDINKSVKFENEIPSDAISIEELFGGAY